MTVGVGDAVDSVVVDDAVADASEGIAAANGDETAEVAAGDEVESECNSVDAALSVAFGSKQETGLTGSVTGLAASK